MRGPTVGEVVLHIAKLEQPPDGAAPQGVVKLNTWLGGIGHPGFAWVPQKPGDAAAGPAFVLTTTQLNLARLLLAICVRPWHAPALISLEVKTEGAPKYQVLRGIKSILMARSRAKRGLEDWWRA